MKLILTPILLSSILALPGLYQGCPPDDDDSPTPALGCSEDTVELNGFCVPDLPEGWTQQFPGGDTVCARGSEFSYFVRPGTVNKLAVGFDGGGACWSASTCSIANPTFSDSVTEDDNPETMTEGVFDVDNEENPFRDWYVVFIPYCTGDIHWGDSVMNYPASDGFPPVTIFHKGYPNANAVMEWIYSHFEAPESIFVTGVSAGSYGTMMFAPYLMQHYSASDVVQLGDSGVGVITQEWLENSFEVWNAQENFPVWIPEIQQADVSTLTMNDVYIEIGRYYPDQLLSQYNTSSDDVQEFYYEAMGGDPADWNAQMEVNIATIEAELGSQFSAYTAWGSDHGILPYSEFYTQSVNGVRIRDWVSTLAAGSTLGDVHCIDCTTPEYYEP